MTEKTAHYEFGEFRLTPGSRQLVGLADEPVPLRGKSFDLLWYLVQNRGRLVEKAELFDVLWPGAIVEENNLSQTVSALRQALGDDAKTPKYLATIKGRGFQFVGEVRLVGATPRQAKSASIKPILLAAGVLALVLAIMWMFRGAETESTGVPIVEQFADANVRLLTDYEGSHSEPTLSPDGRMMAYISNASGTPQLWVKNLEGGDPIQLTDGPDIPSSPSWSPDDDQIIFAWSGPDGVAIYSVGTLGKPGPQQIVEFGFSPNYSLREDAFVYATGQRIFIASNNGRDTVPISGMPREQGFAQRSPALSPDGRSIAFIHADEGPLGNLWMIPVSGGEARQLTTPESGGGFASSPAWSHDGRYIVYSVNAGTGGSHLWRVDVESGEAMAVTTGPGGAMQPILSQDGARLAYTTARSVWRLTRVDPATDTRSTTLAMRAPIALPVLSNDSETIVFFSLQPGGRQIFTVGTDGGELLQRTFDEPGLNDLPTWAGDNDSLLYYRDRALHKMNLSTGTDELIFDDFHWSANNWLDAHDNRIVFHNVDRPTNSRRTVVRSLGESDEIELPVPIQGGQWSPDGSEIAGFYRETGEIMICSDDGARCETIENAGGVVRGSNPMWSHDGAQIYYLARPEEGVCCVAWRVNRDGSDPQKIAALPGFSFANSYYGIGTDGMIFYNHLDQSTNEIWLAETGE